MKWMSCLLATVATSAFGGEAWGAPIYAASFGDDWLYEIDTDTGIVSAVGALGADFAEGGLAFKFNSQEELYGAFAGGLDALYTIDVSNGSAVPVGAPFGFEDVSAIAFHPDGTLFGFDSPTDRLIIIDTTTGVGTLFGDGAIGLDAGAVAGMAFSSDGTLYVVDSRNDSLYAFYDLGSGDDTATWIGDLALNRPAGLTFALELVDGEARGGWQETLYVVDADDPTQPSQLYTVEVIGPGNLDVQPVSLNDPLPLGVGGLAGVIPEPATLILLAAGVLAIRVKGRYNQA